MDCSVYINVQVIVPIVTANTRTYMVYAPYILYILSWHILSRFICNETLEMYVYDVNAPFSLVQYPAWRRFPVSSGTLQSFRRRWNPLERCATASETLDNTTRFPQ